MYSGTDGEYNLDRKEALEELKDGRLQIIFSVDMFNEGLDVKNIDMVLFLRPTQSPAVFCSSWDAVLELRKVKLFNGPGLYW